MCLQHFSVSVVVYCVFVVCCINFLHFVNILCPFTFILHHLLTHLLMAIKDVNHKYEKKQTVFQRVNLLLFVSAVSVWLNG